MGFKVTGAEAKPTGADSHLVAIDNRAGGHLKHQLLNRHESRRK